MSELEKTLNRFLDWKEEREGVVHDVSPHKFAYDEAVQRVLEITARWYDGNAGDSILDELAVAVGDYLEFIESDD